ncbi:hypothetical protein M9979_09675 [Sphingomonas sp. RP10(2022)]|uniref:MPN domain-containing protein n=1 Tax=Sphingomonas liriopis TaxID=2949094 RepID=A0A9X2HPS6_9SPHN|nr:JAB domain-containing protein [Sphingomonas liriopis]MCP3735136.1 hypothetical protein [Sphingomonas liriopis]
MSPRTACRPSRQAWRRNGRGRRCTGTSAAQGCDIAAALPLAPITDARAAAALVADLANGEVERAAVLYLDPQWRFLGRLDFAGSAAAVAPPLRAIVAEAFRLDAIALILAHGHPSGCARPSAGDIAYTRALAQVAGALDMMLVDHLIVTGREVTSLREAGLL